MKSPELQTPSLSSSSSAAVSRQRSWPCPYYCHHRPRTLSFGVPGRVLDTINSSYNLDTASSSTAAPSLPSPLPSLVSPAVRDLSLESVIRSAHSDRLFFDPGATSSSILDEGSSPRPHFLQPATEKLLADCSNDDVETAMSLPYNNSIFLSVDSRDPLLDFRESMVEMVNAHGIKTCDGLVELLWWYLKVNDEANHSYIYGAFIDLSFSQAVLSVGSAERNPPSSLFEFSAETPPDGGPSCIRHYSPNSPLSFDTSSSSAASTSSSSLSMNCASGLEIDDLDKERCSIISSDSSC
ncbi:hypothetical protein MLD38_018532 [Melastoma candidum]|uniref:Uncharacterized protein n=1 Tax=Melastoma candidum TaxID=119954 RepID=A0ACB9QT98_9MYRT|nr:hypothetical protein MLD38_018532 [Melastoma candidum]